MGLALTNTRVRSALERTVLAVDTTVNSGTINPGDAVYNTGVGAAQLQAPSGLTAAIVSEIAKFKGISQDAYPIPYSDSLTETVTNPAVAVLVEGEFSFKTTAGDSLVPGSDVSIGADPQHVQLASNLAPAAPTCALSATAASATNGLANAQHSVALTWITALGETAPGPATDGATTLTTGVDPSITVTVPALPVYALACGIYVDGLLADTATAAGGVTVSGYSGSLNAAPLHSALAIGVVAEDQTSVGGSVGSTVTGAVGQNVVVKIAPKA